VELICSRFRDILTEPSLEKEEASAVHLEGLEPRGVYKAYKASQHLEARAFLVLLAITLLPGKT
jgi:hypothetical protein